MSGSGENQRADHIGREAARLRAKAEEARRFAAKERDLSREYDESADDYEGRP